MSSRELQIEALLLASPSPISIKELSSYFEDDISIDIANISSFWSNRGFSLFQRDEKIWIGPAPNVFKAISNSSDTNGRKLTEAAIETLCYIAVHQPVTTKNIEQARGIKLFKGVLDSLLNAGFIRSSLRKTNAGRAVAYVTTDSFLDHFALSSLSDMPTKDELFELVNSTPDQE